MGPKRGDNVSKGSKLSLGGTSALGLAGAGAATEQGQEFFLFLFSYAN